MSIRAMAVVWDAPLTPTSLKLTALALADWCNDEGGSLHPSMMSIAKKVGVSKSQAQRLVHSLAEAGLLSVLGNAAGGAPGQTPQYLLHLDRLQALAGSTGATGRTNATGSANAAGSTDDTGSGNAARRVAPMRQTGRMDATQTTKNHHRTGVGARAARAPAADCGSRLPADWCLPADWRAWAATERPDLNPDQAAERFRDYWAAVPGAKGRKSDWLATWRNWVRNERSGRQPSSIPRQDAALSADEQFFPEPSGAAAR